MRCRTVRILEGAPPLTSVFASPASQTACTFECNCNETVPAACSTGPPPTACSALRYKILFVWDPPSFAKNDLGDVLALIFLYRPQTTLTNYSIPHHPRHLLSSHSARLLSYALGRQPLRPSSSFSRGAHPPAVFYSYFWCRRRWLPPPRPASYAIYIWILPSRWLGNRT